MVIVPIVRREENIVQEPVGDPRVEPPGGIGGLYLIRIVLSLAPAQQTANAGGIGWATSDTSLEIRLSPWEAARLKDELSRVLGELGG